MKQDKANTEKKSKEENGAYGFEKEWILGSLPVS